MPDIDDKPQKKLWQTDAELDPFVQAYTVGGDYSLDEQLLPYDIMASKAHAKMLHQINIIDDQELADLLKGLGEIQKLRDNWKFPISQDQEDGHTAIEQYLVEHYGEVGKKIHTGRSRNDQSLIMLRLFLLDELRNHIKPHLKNLIGSLKDQSEKYSNVSMPGFTHMQPAMPTTVGVWLNAFHDAFSEVSSIINSTESVLDQNPLGSASGFGIANLQLDRNFTTRELGFARTQENPIYCGLSRGTFELMTLNALQPLMSYASRFAADMMLFTTPQYGYFSLPNNITTGSSIMPQKRNYDVFEIMRGRAKAYDGYVAQVSSIISGLPSGYNRDVQLTKEPTNQAIYIARSTIGMLDRTVSHLYVNEETLKASMSSDLYVTEKVYQLVNQGMAFRDAYLQVKKSLNQ